MPAVRRSEPPSTALRLALVALWCLAWPSCPLPADGPGPTLLERARQALAGGRTEEAVALFRRAADADEAVAAHLGLAEALVRSGRTGEAVAGLGRVADAMLQAGRWAEAETLAAKAVALSPDSAAELARLGRARVLLERFAEAEDPLRRAVAAGFADPATLLSLATAEWENGRVQAAVGTYERALEATGRAPGVLHQLGRLLTWAGRYEEALGPLREARRADPRDGLLLVDLARALDGAGLPEEAISVYREALALIPEFWEARYRLGLLLVRRGEAEAGAEQLALFRRQQAEQQEAARRAGLERARVEEARWLLERGDASRATAALDGLPESPDVLLVRGLARLAAGDPEGAVTLLRRAVALAPEREDLRTQLTAARLAVDGS